MKPRLLDLFCGAGGAAVGYARAGFEVVGIDIAPQPRYPFQFHQADALQVLRHPSRLGGFDVVHASPPCQAYSVTKGLHDNEYPELIGEVRDLLVCSGLPFVIENVAGAKRDLRSPVLLCGSMFGLGVRRHRYFEVNPGLVLTPSCRHVLQLEPVDVTGTGGPCSKPRVGGGIHRKPRDLAHAREVMGIGWMTRPELSEAIPPAYTEFIGAQLLAYLGVTA